MPVSALSKGFNAKLTQEIEPKLTRSRQNNEGDVWGKGIMADRRSLGILGFVFGGVTAAVMLIAVIVVKQHVDGRVTLDEAPLPVMAASMQSVIR